MRLLYQVGLSEHRKSVESISRDENDRKGFIFRYDRPRARYHDNINPEPLLLPFSPHINPSDQAITSEASLYVHFNQLIRATDQFVDNVSVRYFQGMHRYLPIISRTSFHNYRITLGTPFAGFSVLLMCICLITSSSKVGQRPVGRHALYFTTKSLLAQGQGSFSESHQWYDR